MILLGFIAPIFIALFKKKSTSEKHILAKSFIIGLFFPGIGYCLNTLPLNFFLEKEGLLFLNSIFLYSFLCIFFYAYSDYKKKPRYKKVAKFFLIGFVAHSFLGYVFWAEKLNIFWPIKDSELTFSLIDYFFSNKQIKSEVFYFYYVLFNFISFYFYGKFLIARLLKNKGSGEDVYRVSIFLKAQRYLFSFFLLILFVAYSMQILNIDTFLSLFSPLCLVLTAYCMYINYKISFITLM